MLPVVEFAMNNAVHASTGFIPFYVNGLTHPRVPLTLSPFYGTHVTRWLKAKTFKRNKRMQEAEEILCGLQDEVASSLNIRVLHSRHAVCLMAPKSRNTLRDLVCDLVDMVLSLIQVIRKAGELDRHPVTKSAVLFELTLHRAPEAAVAPSTDSSVRSRFPVLERDDDVLVRAQELDR
ncbi:Pol protein [Phytophthora palmivora]|uniref:Pol protein n=1 Tax=Phytophthora palmivora TaxID=4796 RepID=A0A2P4X4N7_9STRA|nr:Pol protein [Phytophthora palmivora]